MIRKTGFRKKAGKFFAILASAAMVVTSIPMNYGYAKADSVQADSAVVKIASETSTVEKNASDVAVLKKIIAEQKERGADVSEDLDSDEYVWKEIDGEKRLTEIFWDNKNLQGDISFVGLEKLVSIYCGLNHLIELNITKNTELTSLYCTSNNLKKLDISKNIKLKQLWCENLKINELDVTNNTSLIYLFCGYNALKDIDVSKNTLLQTLGCYGQDIKELDVSNNTNLTELLCYRNQLTELDISKNDKLEWLWCHSNQLTELNISKNTNLTELYCDSNQLTELDISKNDKLEWLWCHSNQLTELNISKNTNLKNLNCTSNQLTELDVSKNINLTEINCASNQLTGLDVSQNINLTKLNCASNQLTGLDVSQNINLTKLNCASNQLTGLDVSQNVNLTNLNCASNQLTGLDVSQNINLTNFDCSSNQLNELNVLNNLKLAYLLCHNNKLTTLDISKCEKLIGCGNGEKDENNQIKLLCDDNVTVIGGKVATPTPIPTEVPKGNMDKFTVGFNYVADDSWQERTWEDNTIEVTGDGSYVISYTANLDTNDIYLMYLNTNLYNGSLNKDFKFNLTNVTIGSTSYNVDNKGSWGFADNNIENEYRYNIVNPMMGPVSDDGITPADPNITSIDKIGVAPAKKGDVISIYFVVSGMGEKESDEPSLVPTQEPSISPTVKPKVTPSVKPTEIPIASPTVTPTQVPTESPSITPTASPSIAPTVIPSTTPTEEPKATPTVKPTEVPTVTPTAAPAKKAKSTINAKNTYKKYLGDNKFKLNAKTNSDGTVKYKSSNTNVVKVSSKGEITIVGCGEAKVTISVKATDDYKAVSKKVTIKVLPETVQNFKVKALSGGKVKCTWKGKSTKNTNCQIQYSLNKQFKNVKTFASKPSLKSGSYKGKGLKKGKTYYLRIRAIAKSGGKSYTGKWSKTIKVKVK